jgi:hypothetical protein
MTQGLPDLSRDFRAAGMADHAGMSRGQGAASREGLHSATGTRDGIE